MSDRGYEDLNEIKSDKDCTIKAMVKNGEAVNLANLYLKFRNCLKKY